MREDQAQKQTEIKKVESIAQPGQQKEVQKEEQREHKRVEHEKEIEEARD